MTCPKLPLALLTGGCYGWMQWLTSCMSFHSLAQSWQLFLPSEELFCYVLAAFQEKEGKKKSKKKSIFFKILHEAIARNNPGFWKKAAGAGVDTPLVSAAVWHKFCLPKLCAEVELKQFLYSKLL